MYSLEKPGHANEDTRSHYAQVVHYCARVVCEIACRTHSGRAEVDHSLEQVREWQPTEQSFALTDIGKRADDRPYRLVNLAVCERDWLRVTSRARGKSDDPACADTSSGPIESLR